VSTLASGSHSHKGSVVGQNGTQVGQNGTHLGQNGTHLGQNGTHLGHNGTNILRMSQLCSLTLVPACGVVLRVMRVPRISVWPGFNVVVRPLVCTLVCWMVLLHCVANLGNISRRNIVYCALFCGYAQVQH
jgi:hypothetical protein